MRSTARCIPPTLQGLLLELSDEDRRQRLLSIDTRLKRFLQASHRDYIRSLSNKKDILHIDNISDSDDSTDNQDTKNFPAILKEPIGLHLLTLLNELRGISKCEHQQIVYEVLDLLEKMDYLNVIQIAEKIKQLSPSKICDEVLKIIFLYPHSKGKLEIEESFTLSKARDEKEELVKLAKRLIIAERLSGHISERITALCANRNSMSIKDSNDPSAVKPLKKTLRDLGKYSSQIMNSEELIRGIDGKAISNEPRAPDVTKNPSGLLCLEYSESTGAPAKYKHVYIHSDVASSGRAGMKGRGSPEGTEYKEFLDYTEVHVPAVKTAPPLSKEQQVGISKLPLEVRSAFEGYKTFNTVQSITFNVAFETNENMLVCAPTGAGKTDIALISILRVLKCHMTDGVVTGTQNFKIVYVTPMKALASEIVAKLSSRIGKPKSEHGMEALVMEYTGDTALNRTEIAAASVIVTTPEKWDAATRSSLDESELLAKVCLLIIDEIHILNETRGGVIESIVARCRRYVNIKQVSIRIVGLSATLPNYVDVARFLGVNQQVGMFYFDSSYRPLPLEQKFVGVKYGVSTQEFSNVAYKYCYDRTVEVLKEENCQVMIFVHSRVETTKTAKRMYEMILSNGHFNLIDPRSHRGYRSTLSLSGKTLSSSIRSIFETGVGIHHAGLSRSERNFMESTFKSGIIRILCTTSTLAWGVNMPANCVIIKGTRLYLPEKSRFDNLPVTDVLQIFGRAGRPQYEKRGIAYMITSHDKLNHYVTSMLSQAPIDSCFEATLTDNLNAEIALGTVTTVAEALLWLDHTFLSVRMNASPLTYQIKVGYEPDIRLAIQQRKRELIFLNARILDRLQMIAFDESNETFCAKNLGQIASESYISHGTVEIFNTMLTPIMDAADAFNTVCLGTEFDQLKARSNEIEELTRLEKDYCVLPYKGQISDYHCKANILLQSHVSRAKIESPTLFSDRAYIAKNAGRMLSAMFKITSSRGWGSAALVIHTVKKTVDNTMWPLESQLRQFYVLPESVLTKLEDKANIELCNLRAMSVGDIGNMIHDHKSAQIVHEYLRYIPDVNVDYECMPISRSVLKLIVKITPNFEWNNNIHGVSEPWWLWVEDAHSFNILHYEPFTIRLRYRDVPSLFTFTIPLTETDGDKVNNQIIIRVFSDIWVGCDAYLPVSLTDINVPDHDQDYYTELLDLRPLPISALGDDIIINIYRNDFEYFNPIQTQIFHTLYNSDNNVLLGAPTGSGKTISAELAIWKAFRENSHCIVVYIAPLKALVTERADEWIRRLRGSIGINIVKMTGEVTPDVPSLNSADIIVTTPEKWDGVTRFWRRKAYIKRISLVIIDEMHLLGGDRGHVIEMTVTRMKVMSAELNKSIRIIGLSTAFSNSLDVGEWIGSDYQNTFNFRNSARPVPLEIHIDSFPGKHYCPRMDSMNKPIYNSIISHSPDKPVIVFVSSRRQTRLTARDLISFCNIHNAPGRFLHVTEEDARNIAENIKDESLKLSLEHGIGIHHAGLIESDRSICEYLFKNAKIQILVATSTLAWGVNFPAHMVVIKGTEYYDVTISGYRDFSITDILQMMGRAGRPQYDTSGVAHIMVQDIKKDYYKRFLHEPHPLESNLHYNLPDHMNAEIASGTIKTRKDMIEFLSKTFMFSRMHTNPSYYGVKEKSISSVNSRLSEMVDNVVDTLRRSNCIETPGCMNIVPTQYGKVCAFYYVSNVSIKMVQDEIIDCPYSSDGGEGSVGLIKLISRFQEFAEVPVRHNEDKLNKIVEADLPYKVHSDSKYLGHRCMSTEDVSPGYNSPHVKTFLLLLSHMLRIKNNLSLDYITDTSTVLGSCVRVIHAAIDVAAEIGKLSVCMDLMITLQCIKQGVFPGCITLMQIPGISVNEAERLIRSKNWGNYSSFYEIIEMHPGDLHELLALLPMHRTRLKKIEAFLSEMPSVDVTIDTLCSEKNEKGYWKVEADKVYQLKVTLNRKHTSNCPCESKHRCHTKDFPNATRESWWCILADEGDNQVIGISRLSHLRPAKREGASKYSCSGTSVISFRSSAFRCVKKLDLYVMSDSYFGIDKAFDVYYIVIPKLD